MLSKNNYAFIDSQNLNLAIHDQGNTDAELVLHAMIEYSNYDKAIIITGDGDFYCLIEYFYKQKKIEKLIVPNRYKFSSLLRKFAGNMLFMNDLRHKLEYK